MFSSNALVVLHEHDPIHHIRYVRFERCLIVYEYCVKITLVHHFAMMSVDAQIWKDAPFSG